MNKRCKLCQNYINNGSGKLECARLLMGILSCHFVPKEDEFGNKIKELSEIAHKKQVEFQSAVDEVTKLIQTKYPELTAEFEASDGGIIFINDKTMEEFYDIEHVYECLGKR